MAYETTLHVACRRFADGHTLHAGPARFSAEAARNAAWWQDDDPEQPIVVVPFAATIIEDGDTVVGERGVYRQDADSISDRVRAFAVRETITFTPFGTNNMRVLANGEATGQFQRHGDPLYIRDGVAYGLDIRNATIEA